VQKLILDDYRYIRNDITDLTGGLPLYHTILSAIALGDGKLHSVYKRSSVSDQVGDNAVEDLVEKGIIKVTKVKNSDDRLYFTTPFLRFWFAFISPLFHGIQEGDYEEVKKRFENREQGLSSLIFEQLSIELLKQNFQDDPIVESGSYWDREVEIDILAKTASGKIIVGECKYTNTKVNKSELTRLKEKCEKVGIQADIYVLFGKRGFSNELKNLKGADLRLWTLKSFKKLIENLDDKDKIQGFEPSRY